MYFFSSDVIPPQTKLLVYKSRHVPTVAMKVCSRIFMITNKADGIIFGAYSIGSSKYPETALQTLSRKRIVSNFNSCRHIYAWTLNWLMTILYPLCRPIATFLIKWNVFSLPQPQKFTSVPVHTTKLNLLTTNALERSHVVLYPSR